MALHTLGRWVLPLTTMAQGHVEIGCPVDVHVAVAVAVDHVGHGGVLDDGLDQRRAAARNEAVDDSPQPHELPDRLAAGVLDQEEGIGRQAGLFIAFAQGRRRWPDWTASAAELPRRKAALPDFRHRAAASLVTLGRFS